MTAQSAARRYAAALFALVSKNGDAERASQDLQAVSDLVANSVELRQALNAAGVPPAKKAAVVSKVLAAAGGVVPEVAKAVSLLAQHDRLALLSDLAVAFGDQMREANGIMPAEIVTAVALEDGKRSALQSAMSKASGKSVTLSARVDPAIMGGVIARVGSVVFDGSVTRQLERLKQRLTDAQ
jgi:F-type H+-transporting ATPase subunit delta